MCQGFFGSLGIKGCGGFFVFSGVVLFFDVGFFLDLFIRGIYYFCQIMIGNYIVRDMVVDIGNFCFKYS